MNLALFDFDGTITNQDAYTKFLFFTTAKPRLLLGCVLLSPAITLHKLGCLPACKIRPLLTKFAFWGRNVSQVQCSAEQFVRQILPTTIRPQAMAQIEWHKQQGDEIYVISASLSPYLEIWCHQHKLKLICSQLEEQKGRYSGRYLHGDCSLDNKVSLLIKQVNIEAFEKIYAYGDTYEDFPMLKLADEKYFCWEKIEDIPNLSKPS